MSDPRQLRIAVLLDHLESDYHVEIISGVSHAARLSRVRTLVVAGGWLTTAGDKPNPRNFVYDLVASARIDGLVVLAGSLSNYCGIARFQEWIARFAHVPCVTVGLELPDFPSVHVDNEIGVHAVVTHLIKHHGKKRIAFIRGPKESPEAAARQRAYLQVLRDHDIPADERLMVEGGLDRERGTAAVCELLDGRKVAPAMIDAIVGVNDETAAGALDELTRRGIGVPDPIAIVGFDDAASARAANPPLTTVNQQVELQAYTAARALIDAIEGNKPIQSVTLHPEPVIRSSCGCIARVLNDSAALSPPSVSLARTCRLAIVERRATIVAELARGAAGRLTGMSGWEGRLLDALMHDLSTAEGGELVQEVEQLARRNVSLGRDVMVCHDVLTTLRLQAVACAAIEPAVRPRIEDTFQEARLTLSRIGADVERDRQHTLGRRMRLITKGCLALLDEDAAESAAQGKEFAGLGKLLEEHLPAMGIRTFNVTRLLPSGKLEVIARRRLGVGAASETILPANDLGLDPALEREDVVVVEPLDDGRQPVGIAAFAWGAQNPVHYEELRELLGAAIHASRFARDKRR